MISVFDRIDNIVGKGEMQNLKALASALGRVGVGRERCWSQITYQDQPI